MRPEKFYIMENHLNLISGAFFIIYIVNLKTLIKLITAIRYQVQIKAILYIIMSTSEVILFGRMTNPLMTPTFIINASMPLALCPGVMPETTPFIPTVFCNL